MQALLGSPDGGNDVPVDDADGASVGVLLEADDGPDGASGGGETHVARAEQAGPREGRVEGLEPSAGGVGQAKLELETLKGRGGG